ncbi:MAG TPA: division/cell wall cluster transcriptional repressor MraZ, partial [Lacipirellulaceae bacterium]|nr:division/cell wall cluster transcriptional repressor MraZ [Lacipirellulaceae bacterium]
PGSRDVRDYSRVFYSQAVCVVPDSQWRIRVPADLVRRVHLEGEVAVVGVRDHLEIWSAATWDAYIARCEGQYEHLAELAWDAAGPRELGSSPAGVLQGNLHGGDANAPPLPR